MKCNWESGMHFDLPPLASKIVSNLLRLWTTPIVTFQTRGSKVSVKFGPEFPGFGISLSKSIDERLAQIDEARASLHSALAAVEELKDIADKNKADLADALSQLSLAQESKLIAEKEADLAKQVATADVDAFRRVVGIPSRKQIALERLFGFGLGVAASLVASVVWWAVARTLSE